MKNLQTQLSLLLLSTLSLLTGAHGQTAAASSTQSLPSTPLQRKLAEVREHAEEAEAPAKPSQSPTARVDHAPLDPASRDRISRVRVQHKTSPQSERLRGASVAAERYVFGRMDLATDADPDAVAIGAFQTGGPPSIAVVTPGPNPSADTVSILLANPDGTFQAQTDYAVGVGADAIAGRL
jgi:hypothetical protein